MDPEYRTRLLERQRTNGTTPLRRRYLLVKLVEQKGCCGICGRDLPRGKGENHIDHKVPSSRGGTDAAGNIQAVCAPCNWRKGTKRMEELLSQMALPFQEHEWMAG